MNARTPVRDFRKFLSITKSTSFIELTYSLQQFQCPTLSDSLKPSTFEGGCDLTFQIKFLFEG